MYTQKSAHFQIAKAMAGSPSNPYLRSVIRIPSNPAEYPIPVGVVSPKYTLDQHEDVALKCLEGIESAGVSSDKIRLELELNLIELGRRLKRLGLALTGSTWSAR